MKSLLEERRRLIEAIDEYQGDDPLHPWIQCIKWIQEAFPSVGDSSGLVLIYEQCVRTFWHSDRYKDDFRYLKVWLEYADNSKCCFGSCSTFIYSAPAPPSYILLRLHLRVQISCPRHPRSRNPLPPPLPLPQPSPSLPSEQTSGVCSWLGIWPPTSIPWSRAYPRHPRSRNPLLISISNRREEVKDFCRRIAQNEVEALSSA